MNPAVSPVYTVAAHAVASDRPIPALDALRADRPLPDLTVRRRPVVLPGKAAEVFDGTAQVGTRCCRVRSLSGAESDFLEVSGAGAFTIRRAGIEVDPEPGADEAAIDEALLGPVLALALARRDVFVLHASAVVTEQGVAGFLGESGAGKSTLARLLAEAGIPRAADDLLAIGPDAAALPHFPQLKLDAAAMASLAGLASRHPLLALCLLEPAPPASTVRGEILPPGSAAAGILRHTIAGTLFAPDLLTEHLGFAAAVAGRVPVHRLSVPRRLDVGPEVLRYLLS
jgi:hypothetical protein